MYLLRLFIVAILLSAAVTQRGDAGKIPKAKMRKAKALLADLKLVDGAGSGLDADTLRGLKPLVVVDSQGNFVGAVLYLDQNAPQTGAFIVRRIDSTPILVHATAAGFDNGEANVNLLVTYYESADCSGTPLVPADGTGGFYPSRAYVWGTTAYYPVTAAVATHTAQSVLRGGPCPGGVGTPLGDDACCLQSSWTLSFQEAVQFDLTTLGLIPPFHMEQALA
jgi:hypothetical protein